jgi:hypothetical protein
MEPASMDRANDQNRVREGFVVLSETLLVSLSEVFPECTGTSTALSVFRTLIKGKSDREDGFVRSCGALFKKHSSSFKNRDTEALFALCEDSDLFREIDLRTKWLDPGFGEESKTNLWQHLLALKTYAELYCAVPEAVMSRIEGLAGSLGDKLKSGTLDLAKLDISKIGQELMGAMSPEEMRTFEKNLPDIYGCLNEVAQTVTTQTLSCGSQPNFDAGGLLSKIAEMGQLGADFGSSASGLGNLGPLLAASQSPDLASMSALLQNLGGTPSTKRQCHYDTSPRTADEETESKRSRTS